MIDRGTFLCQVVALVSQLLDTHSRSWVIICQVVALGKVRVNYNKQLPMADGSLIDGEGQPTNDPAVMFGATGATTQAHTPHYAHTHAHTQHTQHTHTHKAA